MVAWARVREASTAPGCAHVARLRAFVSFCRGARAALREPRPGRGHEKRRANQHASPAGGLEKDRPMSRFGSGFPRRAAAAVAVLLRKKYAVTKNAAVCPPGAPPTSPSTVTGGRPGVARRSDLRSARRPTSKQRNLQIPKKKTGMDTKRISGQHRAAGQLQPGRVVGRDADAQARRVARSGRVTFLICEHEDS